MDGPPDAAWRLGDALKTEFLAPGAALKSHGGLFQRRLVSPIEYSVPRRPTEKARINGRA